MSYYEIWFAALETMLKERDLVSDDEIVVGHAMNEPKPVKRVLSPADVLKVLHRGGPTERDTNTRAAFKPGDKVRAKNINPPTHTRLPRYVRGHAGVIERVIGFHVFPDSNSTGAGENPQWLYTVRFDGPNCGAPAPTRRSRCRSMPGSRIWIAHDRPRRSRPRHARSAEHPARCRRAGVPRAVGGAGLRHDAGAARARAVHLEGMGRRARRRDQARARLLAIPTPARPIICTGSRRWKDWWRKKASPRATRLHRYRDAWDHACDRTPHGKPIELRADDFG